MAYYSLEPWGEDRADLRSAIIASLIHNSHSKQPRPPKDFLAFKPPKPKQTVADMIALCKQHAGVFQNL